MGEATSRMMGGCSIRVYPIYKYVQKKKKKNKTKKKQI